MSLFDSFNINTSGLALERLKLDTISTNIANVNTTRGENGEPYRKKTVLFSESLKNSENNLRSNSINNNETKSYGVRVTGIEESQSEFDQVYNPGHPDSDENGYISMPNVNMSDEMIDLMKTVRTYEANTAAFESSKNIMKRALEISKD
ncbi:flagellar basal body rod protein FlgC [Vagococcus sp.]|uniref:flagellar basal body rod protein FlgC n=1 Tax=Vagococcus sp. TaxID=1933889 RepID=UPI003F961290